jgi:hypothetical protein
LLLDEDVDANRALARRRCVNAVAERDEGRAWWRREERRARDDEVEDGRSIGEIDVDGGAKSGCIAIVDYRVSFEDVRLLRRLATGTSGFVIKISGNICR